MSTMFCRLISFLFVFFFPVVVLAEITTFEQSVLKDTQSIRAVSMGNAYTALGEGMGALFYNPAGLAQRGVQYGYQDLDNKDNVYDYNDLRVVYMSPFAYSQYNAKDFDGNSAEVTTIGYGKRGSRGIDWGISYKTMTTRINGITSTGVAADLGVLMHLFPFMNLGIMLQDGYTKDIEIPSTFKTGVALFNRRRELILTSDIVYSTNDGDTVYKLNSGAEYHLSDGLIVRGGYFDGFITGGVNLVFPFVELEYAVMNSQEDDQNRHLLGFKFGRGLSAYKHRRRYTMFKPESYAEFAIGGNVVEGKSEISLFGGMKVGSNDLLSMIHESIEDDTCKGYIVSVGHLSSSLTSIALVQEIRNALEKAQEKGKKVYIYLDGWVTLPEYYLASVGDYVVMPELGSMSHLGLKLDVTKAQGLYGNFGVQETVVTGGEHKGGMHPQTGSLTPKQRHRTQDTLDQLYRLVLTDIREDRDVSDNVIETYFDGRLFTATEALEAGLVDQLGYFDDLVTHIEVGDGQKEGTDLDREHLSEFVADKTPSLIGLNKIPVIEIDGTIQSGQSRSGFFFGGKTTGAEDVEEHVNTILGAPFVKGVILRVNSPGGSMIASDRIYRAIERLKDANKVVYTSFGNVAASGGYYVSMGSDKIMANDTTLTGSIGVISSYMSYEGLQETLGIGHETFTTGKYMDMMSPNKRMTEEEKFLLNQHQDTFYQRFINLVQDNREFTDDEVLDVAQGQIFTGAEALEVNLIDDIGDYQDTIDALAKDLSMSYANVVVMRSNSEGLFSTDSNQVTATFNLVRSLMKLPLTSVWNYITGT